MLAQAIPERGNLCTVLAFMPIVRVDDKIIQGMVYPIPGERSGSTQRFRGNLGHQRHDLGMGVVEFPQYFLLRFNSASG